MNIQEKIYSLRKSHNISQIELAEALDVSRQAVSKWEMGTSLPTLQNMVAISKLFGVSLDFLMNDDIESDFDTPSVKAASEYYKYNYKRLLLRIVVAIVLVTAVVIFGVLNHTPFIAIQFLILIGIVAAVVFIIRLIVVSYNKRDRL